MTQGFVFVVESPSDTDLLAGRTEGKALCEALSLAGIDHSYNLVTSMRCFSEAMGAKLEAAYSRFGTPPILHLSLHGNNDGVALTSQEFVPWSLLRQILSPLMNAMNGGLLICMSSCFGASGCRMAMHEEVDAPFWALVGNRQEAAWADAAVAYVTLYHLFFKDFPIEVCIERMRLASGDGNFDVQFGQTIKEGWSQFMAKMRRETLAEELRNYSQPTGALSQVFAQANQKAGLVVPNRTK